jgi:HPt (histidine-containing phosphotransfer) domain-containing protein
MTNFETVFQALPLPVLVFDDQAYVLAANPAAMDLLWARSTTGPSIELQSVPELLSEVVAFAESEAPERRAPIELLTRKGVDRFEVLLRRTGEDGGVLAVLIQPSPTQSDGPSRSRPVGDARPADPSVFDYDDALERLDGEADLLKQVAVVFLSDYRRTMGELGDALARRDAEALVFCAHKLKGALGTLSARAAHDAAARLEQHGRDRQFSEATKDFDQLQGRIDALVPALRSSLHR